MLSGTSLVLLLLSDGVGHGATILVLDLSVFSKDGVATDWMVAMMFHIFIPLCYHVLLKQHVGRVSIASICVNHVLVKTTPRPYQ